MTIGTEMENRRADDKRMQEIHDFLLEKVKPRLPKIDTLDKTVSGLVVDAALHKQSIGRLWWVGGGAATFILSVVGIVAAFG